MAKEKTFIQIGDDVIELKGSELEVFNEQRAKDQEEYEQRIKIQETQKELKISGYKKLGLTDEEIAAII